MAHTPPPGSFCWVELGTTDTESAKAFYSRLLGWTYDEHDMGHDMGKYTMIRAESGEVGGMYPMMPDQVAKGMPPSWLPYVHVKSVAESSAKAAQLGGTVLTEPMEVMEHGRMSIIQDPGGATFALWEPKAHKGGSADPGSTGSHCWTESNTRDFDKCLAFYTALFGWQPEPLQLPGTRFVVWNNDGQPVGGMLEMTAEWEGLPSHYMVYFAVNDADAAAAEATAAGGSIKAPPFDTPYGRIAVISDPQGVNLSIIKLQAAASA